MKKNLVSTLKKMKIKLIVASALLALLILSFFFSNKIEGMLKLNVDFLPHQTSQNEINKSDFSVNYIDVGQGNAIFIRLPDNKTLLIDGGNVEYGEKVTNFLKSNDVSQIDFMVASHADADHIAGLNFVLNEFDVKNIYRPFQIAGTGDTLETFIPHEDEDLADFYNYLTEIEQRGTKISRVTTSVYKNFITNIYKENYEENGIFYHSTVSVFYDGLKIEGKDYCIEFFAPLVREERFDLSDYSNTLGFATVGYGTSDSNDNSAIMLVTIHDFKFLFTGDSSWTSNIYEAESDNHGEIDFVKSLTDEEKLKFNDVSVFLLGHHGSSFSSGAEILELINAEFFVCSVGIDNSYGHPAPDTLARISAYKKFEDYLLMTQDCGTISFGEVDGGLMFCLENAANFQNIAISWQLLGTILYAFAVVVIFSVRTKTKK